MKRIQAQKLLMGSLIVPAGIYVLLSILKISFDARDIFEQGIATVLFWFGGISVIVLSGVNKASSRLYFSFVLVLGLFHLGIPLGTIFGDESFKDYIERWYFSQQTFYALNGIFVFLIGYFGALFFEKKILLKITKKRFLITQFHYKIFFFTFIALIFTWILLVRVVNGVNNYRIYQEYSVIPVLNFVYVYVTALIGFLFVALCFSSQYRGKTVTLFLFWAAFSFPIGLRGEVLFPLAIALPFLVSKGVIKVTFLRAAVALISLLILISVIHQYRADGKIEEAEKINPISAIVEMGGSLRPVYEVFRWCSSGEVDYYWGETYWAPFERLMGKFIPLISLPSAYEDDRLMNVLIMKKAGPYGFSVVAEAYINFGWSGLLLVGFLCGYLLLSMDSKFKSQEAAQYSYIDICLVYALFFHIRQSFVGAYGSFALSFAFCFIITIILIMSAARQKARIK